MDEIKVNGEIEILAVEEVDVVGEDAPAEESPPELKPICPVHIRLFAVLLDLLVLLIVGIPVGCLLLPLLAPAFGAGNLIGYGILVLYGGVMNSRLCDGATLGKSWLGIRVVGKDAKPIPLARSLLRTAIVSAPFLLFQQPGISAHAWKSINLSLMIWYIAMLSLLGTSVYCLGNKTTRQGLHDLIAGSYVVMRQGPVRVMRYTIPRATHITFVILASINLFFVSPFIIASMNNSLDMNRSFYKEFFADNPDIESIVMQHWTAYPKNGQPRRFLSLDIVLTREPASYNYRANEIAALLLKQMPEYANADELAVVLRYGFNLGVCNCGAGYRGIRTRESWLVRAKSGNYSSVLDEDMDVYMLGVWGLYLSFWYDQRITD